MRAVALLCAAAMAPPGCTAEPEDDLVPSAPGVAGAADDIAGLAQALEHALAIADSVEQILLPVPLLTPAEEASLRQSSNAQQLARARALGVRPADSTALHGLVEEGRFVALDDSTSFWVVRELTHSLPYVTPDTRALLEQIGRRFQQRLAGMGLPPFRVEVTSALRTSADQAQLRDTNVNAAAGTSTHEYGTTLDLAYEGYAAPAAIEVPLPADPQAAAFARAAAALALERVAARKSRELQKILGTVLRDMEREGLLMVTLERQQPVYHLTLARTP